MKTIFILYLILDKLTPDGIIKLVKEHGLTLHVNKKRSKKVYTKSKRTLRSQKMN